MSAETSAQLRAKANVIFENTRRWIAGMPLKARLVLGLFLAAALLMALHTALAGKDASLHLKLQHGFRDAQVSLWIDDDLAFSGKVAGAAKKKFGLIPTDSAQGSLSQIIPVRSGRHKLRVRVEPSDAAPQEDSASGDFTANSERTLQVSAHRSSMSMSWLGSSGATPVESASTFGWFSRYAGSFFLTIAGSIMSAVAGYVLKELPARLRPAIDSAAKTEVGQQ